MITATATATVLDCDSDFDSVTSSSSNSIMIEQTVVELWCCGAVVAMDVKVPPIGASGCRFEFVDLRRVRGFGTRDLGLQIQAHTTCTTKRATAPLNHRTTAPPNHSPRAEAARVRKDKATETRRRHETT
ncbi:hypothetical protein ACLKA6_017870 [Drosophila palustris]